MLIVSDFHLNQLSALKILYHMNYVDYATPEHFFFIKAQSTVDQLNQLKSLLEKNPQENPICIKGIVLITNIIYLQMILRTHAMSIKMLLGFTRDIMETCKKRKNF